MEKINPAERASRLKHLLRREGPTPGALVLIVLSVVAIVSAGLFYTTSANSQQDTRWCDLLYDLTHPAPSPPVSGSSVSTVRQYHVYLELKHLSQEFKCKLAT